jgi:pimeloyl-ACP methyl ester carboxylesterase
LRSLEVEVDGSPVRCWKDGDGPNLILLHGGGLDSARLTWGPIWAELQSVATVLAPDLPGFGDTPLGRTTPSLEGYAAWLKGFMAACSMDRTTIAGLSLGGGIALQAALSGPSSVDQLILYAPYGVSDAVPGGKLGYLTVHAPGSTPVTMTSLRYSKWAVRKSLGSLLHKPGTITDGLVDEVLALTRQKSAGQAWAEFQKREVTWSRLRTVFSEELTEVGCRALLSSGEYDKLVPSAAVRAAAARLPRGRFEVVPGAGHWVPRDAPDFVTEQIRMFLRDGP